MVTITTTLNKAIKFKSEQDAIKFSKRITSRFVKNLKVIYDESLVDVVVESKNPGKPKDKRAFLRKLKTQRKKIKERFGFKTVYDHPKMGLYNSICENPVAFCRLKRVWLSYANIDKCVNRVDTYGFSKGVCPYYKHGGDV
jgi:hypothetical protein